MRIHIFATRLSVAVPVIASLLVIAPLTPARASAWSGLCGSGGACWELGSSNGPVEEVNGGNVADESIAIQNDDLCGGSDIVTSTCPFADPALAAALPRHSIVEFQFQNGQCADSTSAEVPDGFAAVSGGDCTGTHAATSSSASGKPTRDIAGG